MIHYLIKLLNPAKNKEQSAGANIGASLTIYKLYKDKMIILITQRVNNLTGFDKIIVIESGKIEMVGNYLDVVNTSKVFNEFIESQKREVSK